MAVGCEPASSLESNGKHTVWSDLADRMTGSLLKFIINAAGSPVTHQVVAEKRCDQE